MTPLALYCKSYRTDLRRVVRLAQSVQAFNRDALPFYVSVPQADLALFQDHLQTLGVQLLSDEAIIQASPRIDAQQVAQMPGHLSQQVVKSEFWRLGLSEAYLCLDSDSKFIRPFMTRDYVSSDGIPYSVMNEAQDLLTLSLRLGKNAVIQNFHREAQLVQSQFNRYGKAYSFGPMPLVWHRSVWEALYDRHLKPNGMNFVDAINIAPLESRWYGEAHLKFSPIPILPADPFFKVYHYGWQLDQDIKNRLDEEKLATIYSGVIYQSSWDRAMDWPHEPGGLISKGLRRIRRHLNRA